MKLMTPEEMKCLDEEAIHKYHVPSILLMEHAAYNVFRKIKRTEYAQNIIIVCGPGNNGGDGLALARQIKVWSEHKVKIFMLSAPKNLSEDGKTYFEICRMLGIETRQLDTENQEEAYKELREADLIIDALFGTGLSRKVEGLYAKVIEWINESAAYTISLDIPSGIDGRTGKIQGLCVQADKTVTFSLLKIGLCLYPAIDFVGELEVADIGIPQKLINEISSSVFTLGKKEAKALLPTRKTRSNKGTYGKVLIIGGQTGMSGAVALAARGAQKAGAGIVTAAVPKAIHDIMEEKLTEVMTVSLKDKKGRITLEACEQIKDLVSKHDVIAIGPGIGRGKETAAVLLEILATSKPCVVDADALYFLGGMLEVLKNRKAPTIITPHPGEMARLTGLSVEQILDDPLETAQNFSKENRVVTVLKIERTVVADREGNIYINRGGNNGMAKGGSGDLLCGIITGLLAQKIGSEKAAEEAAWLGVYLHARTADLVKELKTEYTLLPSDIYESLDEAFKELINA